MYAGWKKRFAWFAMGRLPFSSMVVVVAVERFETTNTLPAFRAGQDADIDIDIEERCISSIEHGENKDWSWACFDIGSTIAGARLFAHRRRALFPPADLRHSAPVLSFLDVSVTITYNWSFEHSNASSPPPHPSSHHKHFWLHNIHNMAHIPSRTEGYAE
jgi:hypothetical protein